MISVAFQNSISTPLDSLSSKFSEQNFGFQVGYDFAIIRRRLRLISDFAKPATEFKNGWGIHASFQKNKEFLLQFSYHRPLIKLYIPLFRIHLLNEFGLGLHYNPRFAEKAMKPMTPAIIVDVMRIRWCNSPVYLYAKGVYSIRNNILGSQMLGVSVMMGLKVYFYKYN